MGRPREFCLHGALEKALEVFWRRGFEGASMAELTAAMGITKPSLYASYGNKEELFRKALDLYDAKYMGFMRESLEAGTSREVVAAILLGMVRATAADGEHPPGCMSMNGTLACSVAADPIKEETLRRRKVFEGELARRFGRDLAAGDLPPGCNPEALAAFAMTIASGIAFQASTGVSSASLRTTAELALRAWPSYKIASNHAAPHKLSS